MVDAAEAGDDDYCARQRGGSVAEEIRWARVHIGWIPHLVGTRPVVCLSLMLDPFDNRVGHAVRQLAVGLLRDFKH